MPSAQTNNPDQQPISYAWWRGQQTALRAGSAPLMKLFGLIHRDRPRSRVEAQFLRGIGTPERLIGPSDE